MFNKLDKKKGLAFRVMQTILYSTNTLMRNQVYRESINHTVYSDKEYKLNFHPLAEYNKLLNEHDLIVVSDDPKWVKDEIVTFNKLDIAYRLINDSTTEFKDAKNIVKLTKPFDLTVLVYYEQFIKPKIYLQTSRKQRKQWLANINQKYTYVNATGNFYTDLNQVPLMQKLFGAPIIQLTLARILPCDNPASFLADSTNNLCLMANPSSPNPLTAVYDMQKLKWQKDSFIKQKQQTTLPLVRLSADNVNKLFKTGKYTMYAVKVGEL